jgi:hypothetical protein
MNNITNFLTLIDHFDGKVFDSLATVVSDWKEQSPRIVSRILTGDGFYIKKNSDDNQVDICKKLTPFTFAYKIQTIDDDGNTKTTLKKGDSKFLYNLIPKYTHLAFVPRKTPPQGSFNTWTDFQGRLLVEYNTEKVKMFESYIFDIWADGKEDRYEYILDWLAHIIQKPYEKTGTALFLPGPPGSGKNVMSDFLVKHVIGTSWSTTMVGISKRGIGRQFNKILMNKLFIVVNELSCVKDDFHESFDLIKSYITDDTINIEPKNVDSFTVENLSNLILFSNHMTSVRIEQGDRRYNCFPVSSKRVGDIPYFKAFIDEMYNQEAGDSIRTYLENRKIKNDVKKIIKTELHEELRQNRENSALRFLRDITPNEEGDTFYEIKEMNREDFTVRCDDFYVSYCNWCILEGEKPMSKAIMGKHLADKITRYRVKKNKFLSWYYKIIN